MVGELPGDYPFHNPVISQGEGRYQRRNQYPRRSLRQRMGSVKHQFRAPLGALRRENL